MSNNLIKYFLHPSANEQLSVVRHSLIEGRHIPLHWHEFIEIEFIVSGEGIHNYNNEHHTLQAGSAFMISHCDFHEITATSKITMYTIQFDKSILNKEMAAALTFNRFYTQLDPSEIEMIIQKAKELQHEMDNDFPFKNIMIKSILSEIVAFMMRKCPPKSISNLSSPIHQLIAYINEHYAEDINLSDLATKFSFSPNYLGQLLKNNLGYTFHEYINLLRLKYACNLLITSDIPLKEVASLAGYRSVEYFLYVFKSKLNMTPQQYRKQADVVN